MKSLSCFILGLTATLVTSCANLEVRAGKPSFPAEGPVVIQHGRTLIRQLDRTELLRIDWVEHLERVEQPGVAGCRLWVRNLSDQPITAAVVIFRVESVKGETFEITTLFDGRLIPGVQDSPVPPGDTTPLELWPPFPADVVSVNVDFVEFADFTTAGPDQKKMSTRIRLRRQGAWQALQYLRRLLAEKGLAEILKIPENGARSDFPERRGNQ